MTWLQRWRLRNQHGPVIAGLFDKPTLPDEEEWAADSARRDAELAAAIARNEEAQAEAERTRAETDELVRQIRAVAPNDKPQSVQDLLREHNVDEEVITLVTQLLLLEAMWRMGQKLDQITAKADPNHIHDDITDIAAPDTPFKVLTCGVCGDMWTEGAEVPVS